MASLERAERPCGEVGSVALREVGVFGDEGEGGGEVGFEGFGGGGGWWGVDC